MYQFVREILLLLNEGCGNFYINVDGESVWDTRDYTEHGYTSIGCRMDEDAEHIEIFDECEENNRGHEHYHRYWLEGIENFKCKANDMEIQISFEAMIGGAPNQQIEIGLNNLSSCVGGGGGL